MTLHALVPFCHYPTHWHSKMYINSIQNILNANVFTLSYTAVDLDVNNVRYIQASNAAALHYSKQAFAYYMSPESKKCTSASVPNLQEHCVDTVMASANSAFSQ